VVQGGESTPVRPDALAKLTGAPGLARMLRSFRGTRKQNRVCPLCGWTEAKFEETKLMGCGLCHTVFAEISARLEEPGTS
jgi:protein-arginine kinase activator protein McsA